MIDGLIIFDCDGVLVDSESLANRVLSQVFGESGFEISPEDCLRRFVGMSMRSVRAAVETESGRRLPDGFEPRVRALADEVFDRDLRPVPGVAEVLSALPHARCVASSGSPTRIRRSLNTTGLDAYFADDILFIRNVAWSLFDQLLGDHHCISRPTGLDEILGVK